MCVLQLWVCSHCLPNFMHIGAVMIKLQQVTKWDVFWDSVESPSYIFVGECVWSIFIQMFVVGSGRRHVFWNRVHNGSSRLSKVVDFGINRKRVCDFLFVINSNLGPILPRFSDIAGFLLTRSTHPISSEFRGCSPWIRCCGSGGAKSLS